MRGGQAYAVGVQNDVPEVPEVQDAPRRAGSDADWPLASVTHTRTHDPRHMQPFTIALAAASTLVLPCRVSRQSRLGLHTLALCSARLSANSREWLARYWCWY
jgi:hypothetical protein